MHYKVLFMNSKEQSLQQLRDIKSMMERSSRFISLSGLSGVFAGIFALVGSTAFYLYYSQFFNSYHSVVNRNSTSVEFDIILFGLLDAMLVLFFSISFGIFFTTRKAKRDGIKIWDRNVLHLLINLSIPLITGGIFCLFLIQYNLFSFVAPCTLIFYGLALVNASKYTLDEIRWLGISEILLGLIACQFIGYGIFFWTFGFGMLHIAYGLLMYFRYDIKSK